jgi:proteasome alpha subunit
MSYQPYVPPEQLFKDRSEFARKGIGQGRSVVTLEYESGILFLAENPSATLHKISEIYDRIAFAGVGKYSEFEDLRISGVRLADLRGYSYGREDVTAKTLANAYSQVLATIFTTQMKPYEVEILVGEVGEQPEDNRIFDIKYDGFVTDVKGSGAVGGRSDELAAGLKDAYRDNMTLREAVQLASKALADVEERPVSSESLEAAILDRTRPQRRKFHRLSEQELADLGE